MTLKSKVGKVLIPLAPVNRRTFNLLRHEFAALRCRLFSSILPWRVARLHKLRQEKDLMINLGSGGHSPEGWHEIDLRCHQSNNIPWDIRTGLPFADKSVKYLYASHVLEHLDFRGDAPRLLNDCIRCLQEGGSVRIVVPDAKAFIDAYTSTDKSAWSAIGIDEFPDDIPTPMTMVNNVFHQAGEHLFAYDFETLEHLLRSSGFKHVIRSTYRASQAFDPDLDLECHRLYSLYVEASA